MNETAEEMATFAQEPIGKLINFVMNLYEEDPEDKFSLSLKKGDSMYTIHMVVEKETVETLN